MPFNVRDSGASPGISGRQIPPRGRHGDTSEPRHITISSIRSQRQTANSGRRNLSPLPFVDSERSSEPSTTSDLLQLGIAVSEETLSFLDSDDVDDLAEVFGNHAADNHSPLTMAFPAPAIAGSSPPPASESAIANLPHVRILPWERETMVLVGEDDNVCRGGTSGVGSTGNSDASDDSDHRSRGLCGICCERLIDGVALTRLPCGHVYHINCVIPWLTKTCTCPECRYELETQDTVYEVGRRKRMRDRPVVTCNCGNSGYHTCFFRPKKSSHKLAASPQVPKSMEADSKKATPAASANGIPSMREIMKMNTTVNDRLHDVDMALAFCRGRF